MDETGVSLLPASAALRDWVAHIRGCALPLIASDQAQRDWLRCGGTWFAGVNLLPNDARGAVNGGPPLPLAPEVTQGLALDAAQLSVIYPGYPRAMAGESAAAFRFRRSRDAAHVDGLLPEGPARRRHLREPHAFILGIPLSAADAKASPMVIWENSHRIMQARFRAVLEDIAPRNWGELDLTETYHAARRACFETCPRRIVHVPVGAAYLVHRLSLHGVAPWQEGAKAAPEGRIIAYFRPELPQVADWLA